MWVVEVYNSETASWSELASFPADNEVDALNERNRLQEANPDMAYAVRWKGP